MARPVHACISRWLVTLSLAVYASAGLFGHALHGFLPCGDEACQKVAAASDACCCGHHEPAPSPSSQPQGAQLTKPGHDSAACSVCMLLAKIKVGRPALFRADLVIAYSYHVLASSSATLSVGLDLTGAPRGPPLA